MIDLTAFKNLMSESDKKLPLVTLEEFFDGNTSEDSIAPNQWTEGRPPLAELWEALRNMGNMTDIAWVRVALHDDTEIVVNHDEEQLLLCGESIIFCTTIDVAEMETLVDCAWLCCDGVMEIEESELDVYSRVPPVPQGFHCLELVWD